MLTSDKTFFTSTLFRLQFYVEHRQYDTQLTKYDKHIMSTSYTINNKCIGQYKNSLKKETIKKEINLEVKIISLVKIKNKQLQTIIFQFDVSS